MIGDDVISIEAGLRTRPHYFTRSPATFAHVPFWQVAAGETAEGQLRDKVVLIGFTDARLAANSNVATPARGDTPAVVAIASAASSLMTRATYSRPTLAHRA